MIRWSIRPDIEKENVMTVKELKDYLKDKDDKLEVYTSVWYRNAGEKKQRVKLFRLDGNISKNGKFLRISWIDDCQGDEISDKEFT